MGEKLKRRTKEKRILIEDLVQPAPIRSQSFASAYPEAGRLWHYKKNCGFGPEDFSYGSHVRAWFKCQGGKDHIYQTAIKLQAKALEDKPWTMGCPFCHGLKTSLTNSVARLYPHLVKEWMIRRNRLRPEQVSHGSSKMIWWKCRKGHVWSAAVCNRTIQNQGCSKCNRGEATDLRDYPETLAEFDTAKNKGVDPYNLSRKAKIFWKCPDYPEHTWFGSFSRRTKSTRCPYCLNRKGSRQNNLKKTHPELAKQWHPTLNHPKKATDVTSGSNNKIWWKCDKGPDHEWQVKVADRVNYKSGCPFCSFRRTSVTNVISTQAPHLVLEWHKKKNGKVTPQNERIHSTTPRWWVCSKCAHEWKAWPQQRVVRGSGCPRCSILARVDLMLQARGLKSTEKTSGKKMAVKKPSDKKRQK